VEERKKLIGKEKPIEKDEQPRKVNAYNDCNCTTLELLVVTTCIGIHFLNFT
jgi:hypothetical protein